MTDWILSVQIFSTVCWRYSTLILGTFFFGHPIYVFYYSVIRVFILYGKMFMVLCRSGTIHRNESNRDSLCFDSIRFALAAFSIRCIISFLFRHQVSLYVFISYFFTLYCNFLTNTRIKWRENSINLLLVFISLCRS